MADVIKKIGDFHGHSNRLETNIQMINKQLDAKRIETNFFTNFGLKTMDTV